MRLCVFVCVCVCLCVSICVSIYSNSNCSEPTSAVDCTRGIKGGIKKGELRGEANLGITEAPLFHEGLLCGMQKRTKEREGRRVNGEHTGGGNWIKNERVANISKSKFKKSKWREKEGKEDHLHEWLLMLRVPNGRPVGVSKAYSMDEASCSALRSSRPAHTFERGSASCPPNVHVCARVCLCVYVYVCVCVRAAVSL